MKKINYIFILIIVVMGYVLFGLYSSVSQEQMEKQNLLARNDSLRVINSQWSTKYAFVKDLNAKKDSMLKNKNETILTKNTVILKLKKMLLKGTAVKYDTVFINNMTKSFVMEFRDSFPVNNPFLDYDLTVVVKKPKPTYTLSLDFKKIALTSFLTRNREGIWSGYVKIPQNYRNYLKIDNIKVVIDRDEYTRIEEDRFKLSLLLGGGIYTVPEVFGHLDLGVEINNNIIYLGKGIGNSFLFLGYSRKFSIIK